MPPLNKKINIFISIWPKLRATACKYKYLRLFLIIMNKPWIYYTFTLWNATAQPQTPYSHRKHAWTKKQFQQQKERKGRTVESSLKGSENVPRLARRAMSLIYDLRLCFVYVETFEMHCILPIGIKHWFLGEYGNIWRGDMRQRAMYTYFIYFTKFWVLLLLVAGVYILEVWEL